VDSGQRAAGSRQQAAKKYPLFIKNSHFDEQQACNYVQGQAAARCLPNR